MVDEIPGLKGLVARMLLSSPSISTREIREAAVSRYPEVRSLTSRRFAARYVVPVKRRMPTTAERRRDPAPPARPDTSSPPPSSGSDLLDAAINGSRGERHASAPAVEPGEARTNGHRPSPASGVAETETRRRSADGTVRRRRLRTLFHRLALEIEMAETNRELVDVLARLDRYVVEALEGGPDTA